MQREEEDSPISPAKLQDLISNKARETAALLRFCEKNQKFNQIEDKIEKLSYIDEGFIVSEVFDRHSQSQEESKAMFESIQNHALVFFDEIGAPLNTELIDDLTQALAHKYDRESLSLMFPSFLKDIQDLNPSLHYRASHRLQKIKLIYSHNLVTRSHGTIFVHTQIKAHYKYENEGDPEIQDMVYDQAPELAQKVGTLLQDKLGFDQVQTFTDISKEQMISQFDSLQSTAEEFERDRAPKEVLVFVIVNVGFYLNNWDDDHIDIWEPALPDDADGEDESEFAPFYALTHLGQPIALCEYATRLAGAGQSINVVLIHDNSSSENYGGVKEHHIDPTEDNFNELVLETRPGQQRLTFAFNVETEGFVEFVEKKVTDKRIFSIPFDIEQFTKDLRKFDQVTEQEQIIFDLRTLEQKQLVAEGKKAATLKTANDIWDERPCLIQQRRSAQWWHPSVHQIEQLNQILMIVASEEEDFALLLFHEAKAPYKCVQEVSVQSEGFQYGTVIKDKRTGENQSPHQLFIALANPDGDLKPYSILKLIYDEDCEAWSDQPKIRELLVDDCNDTNTDALWCSFVVDPDYIILNIPIYGLKIYNTELQQLKGLAPNEVNEFFLDFDIFESMAGDWLLVAEIDRTEEKQEHRTETPPNIYKEDRDEGGFTQLLIRATIDFSADGTKTQIERSRSILLVSQIDPVLWVSEYAKDKMLVSQEVSLLVIQDWEVTQKLEDPVVGNTDKCWMQQLPGFDPTTLPFFISSSFKQFSLINVALGTVQPLIEGTAMTSTGQESFFFQKQTQGFIMHFCTRNHQGGDGSYIFNWHTMRFCSQFVQSLEKYGQLPAQNLQDSLQTSNAQRKEIATCHDENEQLKEENQRLLCEVERLRKALNEKRQNITLRDFSAKRERQNSDALGKELLQSRQGSTDRPDECCALF